MFPLAQADWEENFQDLSGWCVTPSSLDVKQQFDVTTDELNTPIIAPESDEFHFNTVLARTEPKLVNDTENPWGLPSSYDDLLPLNSSARDFVHHIESSQSTTIPTPYTSINSIGMGCEYSELTSPVADEYDKKSYNIFIDDMHQDDYVDGEYSVPLALVEGKLVKEEENNTIICALQTPDIVEMMIQFPINDESRSTSTNHCSTIQTTDITAPLEDLLRPLAEQGEGFDLLAYMFDDNSKPQGIKVKPAEAAQPGLLISLGKPPIASIKELGSLPSTSKTESSPWIKEEEDTEEDDVTHQPPKYRLEQKKSGKRQRYTSTSSEITSVSGTSDYKYRELRDRNNEASKKSRLSRKARDSEMSNECVHMEKVNGQLKKKADEMERLVKKLRQALLEAVAKNKT